MGAMETLNFNVSPTGPLRDFEGVPPPSFDRYPLGLVVASDADVALIRSVDDIVRPFVSPHLLYPGDVACFPEQADGYVTGNLVPAVLDAQILADIDHQGCLAGTGAFGADYLAGSRQRLPFLVRHGVMSEARRAGHYQLHKRWESRYKQMMTTMAPEPEKPVVCGTLVELAVFDKHGRRGVTLFTGDGLRFIPTRAARFIVGNRYVAANYEEHKGWRWQNALIAPLRQYVPV